MRQEFVEVSTIEAAYTACPWAAEIVEVEGGFQAFESMTDYSTWIKNTDQETEDGEFVFKTDSESGKLTAKSYEDACEQLRTMVGDDYEATGAWGWVEDQDGNRLVIGEVP